MSVTDYLALYTTLLGWQQYNNLWNIAVGTGLIYLPFIGIVLTSTFAPFTSMGAKDAAQIAVRRLTINILTAFFVITFAAVPTVNLDPKVLHYDPVCMADHQSATPGHTGTTYDNAFPVATGVKVPVLWYLVMAFSNGVTHAADSGLPCSPINFRQLHTQLDLAKIRDPQLQQEVQDFYSDCYAPAYSTYMSRELSPEQQAQIQQSLTKNGQDDVGWLGSKTLFNVSGFYDAHSAKKPVNGFNFDPNRDFEEGQVSNHSQWGKPDCKTWWNDPINGLSIKLRQALPPNFIQSLLHIGGDQSKLQDAAIKTLINHNVKLPLSDIVRGYESLNDSRSGDFISRFVGAPVGIAFESLSFFPKLHLLINALPVIQGALLFALYTFIALGIPFSSYRIGFCVTGSVVIFSVIFCSFLWNLTAWFDNYLIQALYPSFDQVPGAGGIFNVQQGNPNEVFVDMIVATLYIILPALWLMVMGWAGFQAGQHIASFAATMSGPSKEAGGKAGSIASSILTKRLP